VREAGWESYEIGDLASIFRPETRLTARSRQLTYAAALRGQSDRRVALTRFRDGPWQDPARTLMGAEQEAWLARALHESVARGARWQVLAQQAVMGNAALAPEAAGWLGANASAEERGQITAIIDAGRVGLPFNLDNWDGYPAARARLLRAALDAQANLVVLSGDSHNAWAFDLDLDGAAAGIEIAGQSVTSPGYESDLPGATPAELARMAVARNPQLKWADLSRRGYATITLTPDRATGEWLFLDTIRRRSTRIAARHAMSAAHGANRYGI
jgi:alkaline phosphatase D